MLTSKRSAIAATTALALGSGHALASPPGAPRAALRSFMCQRAVDQPERAVSVTAVMRPMPRTKRMALKFQLLVRSKKSARFRPLKAGDLGKWVSPSDRTLGGHPADVWELEKPVVDLPAPAIYRFQVSFRWSGARGVIATGVRRSQTCRQP